MGLRNTKAPYMLSAIIIILLTVLSLLMTGCNREPVVPKHVGMYINKKHPDDFTKLNSEATFVIKSGKNTFTGIYVIQGNLLKLGLPNGSGTIVSIDDRGITDANGELWTKQ